MDQDENAVPMAAQDNNDCTAPAKTPKERLEELEATIHQGMESFMAVGLALCEIHEKELWRERNYSSFEDYVKGEFNVSKAHGYRLMNHAKICKQLGVSPSEVPEKVTRSLSVIKDKDEQRQVWKEATAENNGKRPSSRVMEKKVEDHIRKQKEGQEQPTPVQEKAAASEQAIDADADHTVKPVPSSNNSISLDDVMTLGKWGGLYGQEREQLQELFTQSLEVEQENAEEYKIVREQADKLFLLLVDNRKALSPVQVEVGMNEVARRLVQFVVSMPDGEDE